MNLSHSTGLGGKNAGLAFAKMYVPQDREAEKPIEKPSPRKEKAPGCTYRREVVQPVQPPSITCT